MMMKGVCRWIDFDERDEHDELDRFSKVGLFVPQKALSLKPRR